MKKYKTIGDGGWADENGMFHCGDKCIICDKMIEMGLQPTQKQYFKGSDALRMKTHKFHEQLSFLKNDGSLFLVNSLKDLDIIYDAIQGMNNARIQIKQGLAGIYGYGHFKNK